MTIKEIERQVLKLIDSYSKNGMVHDSSDPVVKDITLRIPVFIGQAMAVVCRTIPIIKPLLLEEMVENLHGYNYYALPTDFMGIFSVTTPPEQARYINQISVIGERISIPEVADVSIQYKVIPPCYDSGVDPDEILPIRGDLSLVISLYVASLVVIDENPNLSARLLNQFEVELSRVNDCNYFGCEFPVSTSGW